MNVTKYNYNNYENYNFSRSRVPISRYINFICYTVLHCTVYAKFTVLLRRTIDETARPSLLVLEFESWCSQGDNSSE